MQLIVLVLTRVAAVVVMIWEKKEIIAIVVLSTMGIVIPILFPIGCYTKTDRKVKVGPIVI